jgi:type II secretory pathway pseudopilin PulG
MQATKRGFTLLETAAVIGMVSLLAGVTIPAVEQTRSSARGEGSAGNLMSIGQGSAMYAQDHQDRLFTYTWSGQFLKMPDGKPRVANDQVTASQFQNAEILMRRTARIDGPDKFVRFRHLPHRRYTHLVLMDYLDTEFPSEIFADPSDKKLLQWQANPTDFSSENDIPYAAGSDSSNYMPATLDQSSSFAAPAKWQRWAFGSSYQRTVSAWSPDGLNGRATVSPVPQSPHLVTFSGRIDRLSRGRKFAEVAFPSGKVHLFEEFDRRQTGDPYFAYDHARPEKLMFDGSVNGRSSGEANPSWNPSSDDKDWRQTYVPFHEFPIPLGGFGDDTQLSQRYRWTANGLKGVDYAGPAVGEQAIP